MSIGHEFEGFGLDTEELKSYEQAQMKMVALDTASKINPEGCTVGQLLSDAEEIMGWLNKK